MKWHRIKNCFLTFICLSGFYFPVALSQIGTWTYQLTETDSLGAVLSSSEMKLYANDSVVRIETPTKLGTQVLLQHRQKDKFFLLLEMGDQGLAIKGNDKEDSLTRYQYKRTWKKKILGGIPARKFKVYDNKTKEESVVWVARKQSENLLNVYPGLPGMPLSYTVRTEEVNFNYSLVQYLAASPSSDLFGIPSHYKIITFDEFLKMMRPEGEIQD